MALDSSWQASVIKLARTGNSRAIAFWLNRELVPQGICAQIAAAPSGGLAIQIVSRQPPDCDSLVRYICQQLCQLDSEAIQQVRITAQLVGSSDLLWEKSARIILPSARKVQTAAPAAAVAMAEAPTATAPVAVKSAVKSAVARSASPVEASAPDEPARPAASKAGASEAGASKIRTPKAGTSRSQQFRLPLAAPAKLGGPQTLQAQIQAIKLGSVAAADRSIRWFMTQKPTGRALVLGGSAAAAFLIGCSFELASYYVNPAAFQRSTATLSGLFHNAIPSGSVQTVSERIPIIRQAVPNPDDPTISLVFSNSDLLNRLPVNQRNPGQVTSGMPPATTLEAYQQADMLVTNLNHPVISKAAESAPVPPQPDAASDSSDETLRLSGLPAEPDTAGHEAANDHEAEKMAFIADGQTTDETATTAVEPDKKQSPLTPQELVANRVSLVNLANSAVMPDGQTQLSQALNLLKQGNIYAVGAGQNLPEARRPQIFEVKGKRIAYLGYSDSSPRAASGVTAGVNVSVTRQMQEDIQAIRDQVDWVVVSFNWNRELRAYPEDWQVNLAHAAVDDGADLVVGYHPTATQGGEIYNGRAILYSLGNAIDEYSEQPVGSYQAAALKVTLKDHLMQLEFLPLQVKQGQVQAAQGNIATKILQYLEQASSLFDQPLRSPTSLNSQVRLTLPTAPNSEMPTDPFISYPSPATSPKPERP